MNLLLCVVGICLSSLGVIYLDRLGYYRGGPLGLFEWSLAKAGVCVIVDGIIIILVTLIKPSSLSVSSYIYSNDFITSLLLIIII